MLKGRWGGNSEEDDRAGKTEVGQILRDLPCQMHSARYQRQEVTLKDVGPKSLSREANLVMVQGNIERERERSQRGLWKTATGTSQDMETPDVRVMLCVLSRSVMSHSLQPHGLLSIRLLCPWNSPGKNTGVGCCALLQGIVPTQGLNPGLLHCRQTLSQLSHQGRP